MGIITRLSKFSSDEKIFMDNVHLDNVLLLMENSIWKKKDKSPLL